MTEKEYQERRVNEKCLEAEPICEWFGIEVNELFPKEEGNQYGS